MARKGLFFSPMSLAVPALPLLAPADAGPPATGKAEAAELARLKGAWKAISLQVGKKAVRLRAAEWSITFDGDRWTMRPPEGRGAGKVRLDLAQRPPRLDLIGQKGRHPVLHLPTRKRAAAAVLVAEGEGPPEHPGPGEARPAWGADGDGAAERHRAGTRRLRWQTASHIGHRGRGWRLGHVAAVCPDWPESDEGQIP